MGMEVKLIQGAVVIELLCKGSSNVHRHMLRVTKSVETDHGTRYLAPPPNATSLSSFASRFTLASSQSNWSWISLCCASAFYKE
jgi:hypothetical protein